MNTQKFEYESFNIVMSRNEVAQLQRNFNNRERRMSRMISNENHKRTFRRLRDSASSLGIEVCMAMGGTL